MKTLKFYLKLKNDQRGASLAYTLVIIAILMIIGAVLSTFAIMSLRLSVMQHASDKAFYLSDAAMVESLTQLESYVHEAEIYATERVNSKAYYTEDKWQAFLRKLERDTNTKEISMQESIAYLEAASNFEFQKQYYHYLFGKPTGTTWIEEDYTLLDGSNKYVKENNLKFSSNYFTANRQNAFDFLKTITLEPSTKAGFEATTKPTMEVTPSFENNAIRLMLKSNGTYNRYNKPITLKLALIPPDYSQVISVDSTSLKVRTNDVLEYGLAARGNIIVSGDSNEVDGNVYTFGTFPNKHDYKSSELGGLLVGYDTATGITSFPASSISNQLTRQANLNISGNLYTRSTVKLYGQGSHLTVGEDTYANFITFDKNSKSGNIEINKNAYLFEDLILDGENPTVTIGTETDTANGELWGLMDTNPNFDLTKTASSLSSSIIVNTKSDAPKLTVNKFFMAGLIYFDVTRTIYGKERQYQTGEAFSTNNNFYFYKTPLVGFNSALQSNFFEYADSVNKHYLIEPLDQNGDILKSPLFKDKYFYTSVYNNPSMISDRDRSILTVRSLNLNDPDGNTGLNNNYSIGVMIANKRVIDAYKTVGINNSASSDYMDANSFSKKQTTYQNTYDEKTSLLSVRNYKDYNNINPLYDTAGAPSVSNKESNLDLFIAFPEVNFIQKDNPNEVIIVNSDPSKHVYLNIPKDAFNALPIEERTKGIFVEENFDDFLNINGMIITKGNVYVYNTSSSTLNYKGTIVSDGDICLLGTGKKVFKHDPVWIAEMSAKQDNLKTAVHASTGKKLVRKNDTTSRNASLMIDVTNSTESRTVFINKLPTSNGVIKTNTKSNFSFNITGWSMD